MDGKNKTFILIAGYLIIRIPIIQIIVYYYKSVVPDWVELLFFISAYFIIALLIHEERDHLGDFHMDKLSLVVFLLFGAVLRIFEASLVVKCFGGLAFGLIALWLIIALRRSKVQLLGKQKMGFWIIAGFLVGAGPLIFSAILILIAMLVSSGSRVSPSSLPFRSLLGLPSEGLYYIVFYFIDHLGNLAISEEPVFRG
ncbi:MAG: hypothetical protein AB1589_43550, partial [Cyanobacteriota bacterium]